MAFAYKEINGYEMLNLCWFEDKTVVEQAESMAAFGTAKKAVFVFAFISALT